MTNEELDRELHDDGDCDPHTCPYCAEEVEPDEGDRGDYLFEREKDKRMMEEDKS